MKTQHIYGMHDWDTAWAALVKGAAKTGWCVVTEEIGDNPNDMSGRDYRYMAEYGITPVVRLNYSHHGQGTIPVPERYDEFAIRCGNFVRASQGCVMWVIGNEPNIEEERPDNRPILPADYIHCYKMCYRSIKQVSVDHRVAIAPVAPYNDQTGWCITYWRHMLQELGKQGSGTDFLVLHTYSRGGNPNSVFSSDKMGWPYDNYYNGFRAYQDFLNEVPQGLRHLRAYITETDQLEPWDDTNSGWVMNAYKEINNWNAQVGTTKIDCLALYRWPKFDRWWIVGKNGVVEDFKHTLNTTDFRVAGGHTVSMPVIVNGPSAKITAPAGANVRSGPGTSYAKLGALPQNDVVPVLGQSGDKEWWHIQSPWGSGWVYAPLVQTNGAEAIPVVVSPPPPTPPASQKLDRNWLVGALSKVLGIDTKVAMAVLAIESAGRSFEGDRMIIRFENHVFHSEVSRLDPQKLAQVSSSFKFGNPRWTGHQWLNPVTGRWENQHDGGQAEEWATFNLARKINETAAMRSISMGSAQVLGTNHAAVGYPTVQEMFYAYNDKNLGEYNQVTGFFAYLVAANLVTKVKEKDWRGFAASYNGAGNVDYYANAMRQKYLELGGRD